MNGRPQHSVAETLYAEHVKYLYNRCLHVYPGFADPPGYRTIKTLKYGALTALTALTAPPGWPAPRRAAGATGRAPSGSP